MAGEGTKRIVDLTEAAETQSGDYIAIDSTGRGTRKLPAGFMATAEDLSEEQTERQTADATLDGKITAEAQARLDADNAIDEQITALDEKTEADAALIQNPTKTLSGALVSFTDGAEMPAKSVIVNIEPQQSGTGTPSPDNVRPISGWESVNVYVSPTEDEADGHTTTTSLGRTVYGGTLDVVSGVLTVDRAMATFDGSSDEYWGREAYQSGTKFVTRLEDIKADSNKAKPLTTNLFVFRAWAVADYGQITNIYWNTSNLEMTVPQTMTVEEWREFLQNTPLEIIYYLATPQTYQLTPTEVKTLLGENNVWADSGDVEITYRRDISIVINNLESALNG